MGRNGRQRKNRTFRQPQVSVARSAREEVRPDGGQPRANAEVTAHTHVTAHAAWIASQLNRKLTWDPAKRMFIGDEEANRMRSRAYREPWRLEALATSM